MGVLLGGMSVELADDGTRLLRFLPGMGSDMPITLLPTGTGAINCALQQGKVVLAGPLVGGEIALARNAQGLQLALASDQRLEGFAGQISGLEILAQTAVEVPNQVAMALAPGRFQIALLSPMPPTISLFDLAPVQPPIFGTPDRPATSGELYVIGKSSHGFH